MSHDIRNPTPTSLTNPSPSDFEARIDKKTQQLCYFECDVQLISQSALRKGTVFSNIQANRLFERNAKKRCGRSQARLLIDRVVFQRRHTFGHKLFRKEVVYRDIRYFFASDEHPELFMFCVIDDRSKRHTYEIYRCDEVNIVHTICALVYNAVEDPQFILRDEPISPPGGLFNNSLNRGPTSHTLGLSAVNIAATEPSSDSPIRRSSSVAVNRRANTPSSRLQNDVTRTPEMEMIVPRPSLCDLPRNSVTETEYQQPWGQEIIELAPVIESRAFDVASGRRSRPNGGPVTRPVETYSAFDGQNASELRPVIRSSQVGRRSCAELTTPRVVTIQSRETPQMKTCREQGVQCDLVRSKTVAISPICPPVTPNTPQCQASSHYFNESIKKTDIKTLPKLPLPANLTNKTSPMCDNRRGVRVDRLAGGQTYRRAENLVLYASSDSVFEKPVEGADFLYMYVTCKDKNSEDHTSSNGSTAYGESNRKQVIRRHL